MVQAAKGCALEAVELHVICLGAAATACARGRRWAEATKLLDCCGHAQLETNVVIGSTALNSLVEKWAEAMALLWSLRHGIELTTYCFNSVLPSCGLQRWPAASFLLEQMRREHLLPDIVSINTAIAALEGSWPRALRLAAALQGAADVMTVGAAISACTAGRWEAAITLLSDAVPSRLAVNRLSILFLRRSGGGGGADDSCGDGGGDGVGGGGAGGGGGGHGGRGVFILLLLLLIIIFFFFIIIFMFMVINVIIVMIFIVLILTVIVITIISIIIIIILGAIVIFDLQPGDSRERELWVRRWEAAMSLLKHAAHFRQANIQTYTVVIGTCGRASRWELALALFAEVSPSDVDLFAFSAAIVACIQRWDLACALLSSGGSFSL
ncbi:hypothetical protein AK812_SmicGene32772, partial [Symbiodinium microadriaticum]